MLEGRSCIMTVPIDNVPLKCATGTADCDGKRDNGCEISLASHQHCGACGKACTEPGAYCTPKGCKALSLQGVYSFDAGDQKEVVEIEVNQGGSLHASVYTWTGNDQLYFWTPAEGALPWPAGAGMNGSGYWSHNHASSFGGGTCYLRAIAIERTGTSYFVGKLSGALDLDRDGANDVIAYGATSDIFFLRMGADRVLTWYTVINAAGNEVATDAVVTPLNRLFVVGTTYGDIDFGKGMLDKGNPAIRLFIAEVEIEKGKVLWAKTYGGSSESDWIVEPRVALDSKNNLVVFAQLQGKNTFGKTVLTENSLGYVVASFTPDGTPRWAQLIDGIGTAFTNTMSPTIGNVVVDQQDRLYIAGSVYVHKPSNLKIGAQTFPLPARGIGILAHFNAQDGEFKWLHTIDSGPDSAAVQVNDVALDQPGNIYILGGTSVPTDFGQGVKPAQAGMFIASYVAGTPQIRGAESYGGITGRSLAILPNQDIFATVRHKDALTMGTFMFPAHTTTWERLVHLRP